MSGDDTDDAEVERWFIKRYAYSTTVAGLRGKVAVKAFSKLDYDDSAVPILVEPEELDSFDEVDVEDVPEWGRESVRREHQRRSDNIRRVSDGEQ